MRLENDLPHRRLVVELCAIATILEAKDGDLLLAERARGRNSTGFLMDPCTAPLYVPREDRELVTNPRCIADVDDKV